MASIARRISSYIEITGGGWSVREEGNGDETVGRKCDGGKRRIIQTDRDIRRRGWPLRSKSDSGFRVLSIHVPPSISHLIERNARNRQLDSVRYINPSTGK